MPMSRFLSVLAPPSAILLLAGLGLAVGGYIQYIFALTTVAMTIGVSLVLVVGLARIITLASGAMMAIGAYGLALLMIHARMDILAGMIIAAFLGGLAGMLLGLMTIRFKGHHLAMVTLVFQFVVIIVLRQWPELTGGAQGIWLPKDGRLLGFLIDSDAKLLVVSSIMGILAVALVAILVKGHFGKVLQAISATESGAEAFGIDLAAYRIAAFAISSAVIALAGTVYGLQVHVLEPEGYGVLKSVSMLAYPIVGGLTSIWGGLIGGSLLRLLPEALRVVADYQELLYSLLVVAIMIVSPDGVVGFVQRLTQAVRPPERSKDGSRVTATPRESISARTPLIPRAPVSTPAQAMLELAGVAKSFGALQAVKSVSLAVPEGSIYGIIGPNGAGKTTLFNMISGFLEPDQGAIRMVGRNLNGIEVRNRIGLGMARTFQNVAIYHRLTCLDNVVIGLGQNNVFGALRKSFEDTLGSASSRDRQARAMAALQAVGLAGSAGARASSLSLGNQRRLEIARALVSNPKLLMLDEPVSGLDTDEQDRIRDLLLAINAERGMTMLVIEHNIHFIVQLSQILSVMHSGALLVEGNPHEVVELPEVRRVYFGEPDCAA